MDPNDSLLTPRIENNIHRENLVELGVRVAELGQDAAAGEGRDIDIGDESNLARQAGRSILGAVDALELVLLDVGLGLGDLDLGADDEALPL